LPILLRDSGLITTDIAVMDTSYYAHRMGATTQDGNKLDENFLLPFSHVYVTVKVTVICPVTIQAQDM
jgi:hypothetical protein